MTNFEYLTNRNVLVTGGGGFIGGYLAGLLRDHGVASVRVVDRKPLEEWHQRHPGNDEVVADLHDPDVADRVTRGMDIVFNLACDMGGMGFIERNKALCMLSVIINTNLLVAAREHDVGRYFFSSSACVYAADRQRDSAVTALREGDAYPAEPEDGYGWEKLFSERMCRHFTEDFEIPTFVARYHNVYGPHGSWTGGREKAPAAVCRKVAEAKWSGDHRIEIWGDGQQTRSFMYIDDCTDGTLRLTGSDVHEPLNIGSSELVSIDDLVSVVEQIAGVELERRYDLSAPLGVRGRNSDNALILQRLGWEPSTSLRDGLQVTYEWIERQVVKGPDHHQAEGARR